MTATPTPSFNAVGFTPAGKLGLRKNRRLRNCLLFALVLHVAPLLLSLVRFSCTHDTPLGLPGGTGDKIAKGTPDGAVGGTGKPGAGEKKKEEAVVVKTKTQQVADAARATERRARRRVMERFTTDGLHALLTSKDHAQVRPDSAQQLQTALDNMGNTGAGPPGPRGLESGEGSGDTRSGSRYGKGNGAFWLYRLKYSGGDWDANPQALPALLAEVRKLAGGMKVGDEEVVRMTDLPNHRGPAMPRIVFITGTGAIESTEAERAALKDYLLGGGMMVADSSGGNFEQQFVRFMQAVLPGKTFRPIEFDHDVFRGPHYQMTAGCPIYRDHGSSEARGIFDADNRLMVFLSPGDMGSAWAVVDLGKKRGPVEQAFHMGTNLVDYSLKTVNDKRK